MLDVEEEDIVLVGAIPVLTAGGGTASMVKLPDCASVLTASM